MESVKNVRALADGSLCDAKFRACAGICGLEGIIESEAKRNRDKCVLMNLAVNFSIASRKFIVGDASSGVLPDSIDFSSATATKDSTLGCAEYRVLVPHKAKG